MFRPHMSNFFGLPGNLSDMVTFELFVLPMIRRCWDEVPALFFGRARLKSDIRNQDSLKRFLPASLPESSRMLKSS